MRLYRVSFDLKDSLSKTFTPLIPESAGLEEDKTIKRVCLSSSIAGCLQAIPRNGIDIKKGAKFIVYEAEINERDENLVHPEDVRKYVPDALENNEYWYLNNLTMEGRIKTIQSFDYEYDLSFTSVNEEDFICKILEVIYERGWKYSKEISDILIEGEESLKDRYNMVSDILYKNREYDLQDEIYDEVAMLPWAQALRIENLRLSY